MSEDNTISKTKKKQKMLELQKIGVKIANLPEHETIKLDLPKELKNAFEDYRKIKKHGAKKRQAQFIGKLMRKVSLENDSLTELNIFLSKNIDKKN